jgi:hypothetical protein
LTHTKLLLINASEPTDQSFELFVDRYRNNKQVKIFSDAVLNTPTPPKNFYTAISWFIQTENYYATRDWAKKLLNSLDPVEKKIYRRKFDCLLGVQKDNRDFVNNKIVSSNLQHQFDHTYFKNNINDGQWSIPLSVNSTSSDYCVDGLQHVPISSIIPVDIYNQTLYSIVAETSFFNQWSQYTEKTAKPILTKRPFVAFCGQHFLRNLQKLGFQTFGDVVDESYDSVEDNVTRWNMAWKQVEKLCGLPPNTVFDQLAPILEHNQQHFLTTDWHSSVVDCLSKIG